MNWMKRTCAVVEILLVLPATLFMASLFARDLQPTQYQPAKTAAQVVDWFAARPVLGLDIILVTLPFIAFVVGCAVVVRQWRSDERLRASTVAALAAVRAHLPWLVIAGATFVAGSILAIVALHMITE